MDSVTQFVLGAAVAEAAVGRRVGRAAPLIGGILGTLPDLDVFVPLGGAVEDFTYHRSATHSLLVLSLLSPMLAWLNHRLLPPSGVSFGRWTVAVWLVLVTHPLLDALTVYGTQLLWPLSEHPFGFGSVFIIDPLYTLPLALGLLAAMALHRRRPLAGRLNAAGLAVSSAYLVFGVAAQAHTHGFAQASLARQGIEHEQVLALAAPFTSLAWRVVAVSGDAYHVGYHSVLAPAPELRLQTFPRAEPLLDSLRSEWAVQRLRWFTKGFYTVDEKDGEVRLTDLRMGVEPDRYAFTFVVGARQSPTIGPAPVRRIRPRRFRDGDLDRILAIVRGAPAL
jgi:inner membrane protein